MSKQVSLPKISSILQKMKISQNSIYTLFARRPSIVSYFNKLHTGSRWLKTYWQSCTTLCTIWNCLTSLTGFWVGHYWLVIQLICLTFLCGVWIESVTCQPRCCWTWLTKYTKNFHLSSFSSDCWTDVEWQTSVRTEGDMEVLEEVHTLLMLKEIVNDIHIKFFTGQYLTVDVFNLFSVFMGYFSYSKTQWQMFLLLYGRHICAPQKDTNMASPYKAL